MASLGIDHHGAVLARFWTLLHPSRRAAPAKRLHLHRSGDVRLRAARVRRGELDVDRSSHVVGRVHRERLRLIDARFQGGVPALDRQLDRIAIGIGDVDGERPGLTLTEWARRELDDRRRVLRGLGRVVIDLRRAPSDPPSERSNQAANQRQTHAPSAVQDRRHDPSA
jgi:hypothetical protein